MPSLTTTTRPAADLDRLCALTNAMTGHEAMVRRYVGALSGRAGDVDDLAQEVFVRTIERIDRLHSDEHLPRFLRGVARRVVREHHRRRRRHACAIDADTLTLFAVGRDAASAAEHAEQLHRLQDAVDALPLVSRRMLEMCYAEDRTAGEIGAALGIKAGAVRVSLLRIRDRLRKTLA